MDTISGPVSAASQLTPAELSRAESYLNSTRENLVATVEALSDAQWHFKPAPDCWSIAEILEHIILVEERVHGRISQLGNAPAAEPDRAHAQIEEGILNNIVNRGQKFRAPEVAWPTHHWPPQELIARFDTTRNQTIRLLYEAPHLRGRVLAHPVAGTWDGYQWILGSAAHAARHTDQIREVKGSSGFPG